MDRRQQAEIEIGYKEKLFLMRRTLSSGAGYPARLSSLQP